MVVTVYIWLPDGSGRVGHASMELSNGVYISWWPPGDKKDKKLGKIRLNWLPGGSTGYDLNDDIENEGGSPNYIFPFNKDLDEDVIEAWWITWSTSGHYTLLGCNCCWVVYNALRLVGAPFCLTSLVWNPGVLRQYVNRCANKNGVGTFWNFPD